MHVTLRAKSGLPSFRKQVIHALVLRVLRDQARRTYAPGFQIVHFSIQTNHLHMIVEAADGPSAPSRGARPTDRYRNALRSGISGFLIAFARRLNALLGRKGKVWDDRYHRHDLIKPHEVKTSLRYVLSNFRKHGEITFGVGAFDLYSSAEHFDGWLDPPTVVPLMAEKFTERIPRTWLLAKGWRRHGLIGLTEIPGPRPRA